MSAKAELRRYRKTIREEWAKIVMRAKLSSHEYLLTEEWFKAGVPVNAVLRAIHYCAARARSNGHTLYSLGVIKPDLEAVLRQDARMNVGAGTPGQGNWRERMAQDLEFLAEFSTGPEQAALLRGLRDRLPSISSWEEAQKEWRGIA